MSIPFNNENRLYQSPYLYCQGAGSNAADKSKEGIHLRWDLLKELGENHIPKGDSTINDINLDTGFNKENDFVTIYRTEFKERYSVVLELEDMGDDEEDDATSNVQLLPDWQGISYKRDSEDTEIFLFRFTDREQFISYILENGPNLHSYFTRLLHEYTDIIEIELKDKLLFSYEFVSKSIFSGSAASANGTFKHETVSLSDTGDAGSTQIIARKYVRESYIRNNYPTNQKCIHEITVGENIKFIRVQHSAGYFPIRLIMYAYINYFEKVNEADAWEEIGNYAIVLNGDNPEDEIYRRIEGGDVNYEDDNPQFTIEWPKYVDDVLFNPENYVYRWQPSNTAFQPGMKETLQTYIEKSNTDPRALVNVPFESENGNTAADEENSMTVSLHDMLKLASVDYHAARMLGLATIDANIDEDLRYIYLAFYTTERPLPGISDNADHLYMTLPTGERDYRLPLAPRLNDITYGMKAISEDSTEQPKIISDENGYSHYYDVRFINLNKVNQGLPQPVLNIIPDNAEFDITQITQPAAFGIKYKKSDEDGWRQPEILQDIVNENASENGFTLDSGDTPLYIHFETEAGIHDYALYSINWFSRCSKPSNLQSTDNTFFKKKNRLLPPSDVSVQYIQEEDPLIFTTQAEQDTLQDANTANPNGDNCKTRILFTWDDVHNNAYQYANKIEFFFRDTEIKKIEGKIQSVISISLTECKVVTTAFVMASVSPAVTIAPFIQPGTEQHFIGSILNTIEGQFEITAIALPADVTEGPSFTVKKLIANEVFQGAEDEPYITIPVYTPPKKDDIFFVFENIQNINQWHKLSKTIDIIKFSEDGEVVYEQDGSQHEEYVGGIYDTAFVEPILNPDTTHTGGYTITFNTKALDSHPDPAVTWVRGSVRVPILSNGDSFKKLTVASLQQLSPVIKVIAYDPEYSATETARNIQESLDPDDSINVRYHPAYKVYLGPETAWFNKTNILPPIKENVRKTYIALRSTDSTIQTPLYSNLTPPAILVALNIQKPLAPLGIKSPLFATRPDVYGKSTYTMDIELDTNNRLPYGLMVYRSNEMSILQELYNPETLQGVLASLKDISEDDPYKFSRWQSLLEVETYLGDETHLAQENKFIFFGGYRFPNPDNSETRFYTDAEHYINPFPLAEGETILSKKDIIKKVIENAFAPITELPVVLQFLKEGFQTSSTQPKIRDLVGRLLDPSDAAFDPSPMAIKLPGENPFVVRFTDYSLDGNARNIYFYYAKEVAINTGISERTKNITGPVILIDASPAEPPVIRKVLAQEAGIDTKPAVLFEVADYIDSEAIDSFQLFRTTDYQKGFATKAMSSAGLFKVGAAIKDEFKDLEFPPYGELIYYRIVALRKIINEKMEPELIPSKPSELMLANIIDVTNPEAPAIRALTREVVSGENVIELQNVSLSWPKTTHNGKYYLYKMNDKGNWQLIWNQTTNASFIDYPEAITLPKMDDDGNTIYHRYKVSVENANGLFNLEEKELVL